MILYKKIIISNNYNKNMKNKLNNYKKNMNNN